MNITDVRMLLELFGFLLRPLGVLVFGLATGWLAIQVIRRGDQGWQLTLGALLGVLATFVLLGHWVEGGGTLGMFGLGTGAGILIWGLVGSRPAKEEEEAED